jgi:hypothetical protein
LAVVTPRELGGYPHGIGIPEGGEIVVEEIVQSKDDSQTVPSSPSHDFQGQGIAAVGPKQIGLKAAQRVLEKRQEQGSISGQGHARSGGPGEIKESDGDTVVREPEHLERNSLDLDRLLLKG